MNGLNHSSASGSWSKLGRSPVSQSGRVSAVSGSWQLRMGLIALVSAYTTTAFLEHLLFRSDSSCWAINKLLATSCFSIPIFNMFIGGTQTLLIQC